MLPNAFIGSAEKPTEEELATALGPGKALWDRLLAELNQEYEPLETEWNSYSRKAGWSLRLKRGKRNIIYLTPCRGSFQAAVILGDRAIESARQSRMPQAVLRLIEQGQRYPEGTAIRMEVKGVRDLPVIRRLTGIKLQN